MKPSMWMSRMLHDDAPNGEVHTPGDCNLAGVFQSKSLAGQSHPRPGDGALAVTWIAHPYEC